MSKTAARPNFLNIPVLSTIQNEGKGATDEEKALYAMSKTAGWKILEDVAQRAMRELDNTNKEAIASGASLEEIGRNTVVVNLAQGVIEKLLNKVTDAVEACENGE